VTESSPWLKIGAAFVTGLVLALGGSLVYVKVTDQERPPIVVQEHRRPVPAPVEAPASLSAPAAAQVEVEPKPSVTEPQADQPKLKESYPKRVQVKQQVKPVFHKPEVLLVAKHTPPIIVVPPPAVEHPATPVQQVAVAVRQPQLVQQESAPPPETAPPEPVYQPHVVTLPAGANLNIRLAETLSTASNYSGDTFRGTLDGPIIMDGFVIADKGSKVLGRVVVAQKAGRVDGVSQLSLALTEINTTDSQRVRVSTNTVDRRGPASTGRDAAEIAGGAALGAIIGAIAGGGKGAAIGAGAGGAAGTGAVLLTRGRAASFGSESLVSFRLAVPVTITERINHKE